MEVDTTPQLSVLETCSLYAIDGDTCGQSDLDCTYVKYAKAAEKSLKDGTCAKEGYTVKGDTETKHYPVVGDIVITKYTKPVMEFVTGGTLKLSWKDCGSTTTHGHVTSITPSTHTLRQKPHAVG